MDGMKSGAGDDPFADDTDDGDGDDPGAEESAEQEAQESVATTASDATRTDAEATDSASLPWLYARENAKSNREMVQFFLQDETKQLESDAVDELEARFSDDSVRVFDVREAAYQVALTQHLDSVADQLREWGYDVK